MSATNRGAKRNANGNYQTPPNAIDALLENVKFLSGGLLEPCAGSGGILRRIKEKVPNSIIPNGQMIAVEIRKEERESLMKVADRVIIEDFLTWTPEEEMFIDTIITNPDYEIAEEVIEHCFEIAPHSDIMMLLRLGFLAGKNRRDFWKRHPLAQLLILSDRPSFGTYVRCQNQGCDWEFFYHWFQEIPKICPICLDKVKKTSNDATDYGWFVFSKHLPPLIKTI
jgi:hypothetical protein